MSDLKNNTHPFPELTEEELFAVLLGGQQPMGGYSIDNFIEEWNWRVENQRG